MPSLKTVTIAQSPQNPRIARMVLNRPERLNAINEDMPADIRAAVQWANDNDEVHVIVLEGAGKGFCGGYDLVSYAEQQVDHPCQQQGHP